MAVMAVYALVRVSVRVGVGEYAVLTPSLVAIIFVPAHESAKPTQQLRVCACVNLGQGWDCRKWVGATRSVSTIPRARTGEHALGLDADLVGHEAAAVRKHHLPGVPHWARLV